MQRFSPICVLLLVLGTIAVASCGTNTVDRANSGERNSAESSSRPQPDGTPAESKGMSSTTACYSVDTGTKTVLRSQTFAIDFEPFRNSCFVTSHDPEFKDPALESEIAIYRDGKRSFTFPEQFNGVQVGCWVEAVSFEDVNADRLTDVIVIGKCSGKSASYHENSIYINDGKAFITRPNANYALAEHKSIKDVVGFAKANPSLFSVNTDAADNNSKS